MMTVCIVDAITTRSVKLHLVPFYHKEAMVLIGIGGAARSGKDSLAVHLFEKYGFATYSFARPLKDTVGYLFDMTYEQLYGDEKEVVDQRYGRSPRWLLQYLGTDVLRNLYPDIWVDLAIRWYKDQVTAFGSTVRVVIPDVRFRNEISAIRSVDGFLWKTIREDHHGASSGIEGHQSEAEIESIDPAEFDLVLSAKTGELQKLYDAADLFVCRQMRRL